MKKQATNRTHLTVVSGDTVQQFTITQRHPAAKPLRLYYWQGDDRILRTQGAYNGNLLDGNYQLSNRRGQLLGSGKFSKGLKTGLWRTWEPDGMLLTSRQWHHGRPRGRTVEYDANGQPLRKPQKAATAAHWWHHSKKAPTPATPASAAAASQAPPAVAPPAAEKKHRLRLFKKKAVQTPIPASAPGPTPSLTPDPAPSPETVPAVTPAPDSSPAPAPTSTPPTTP